MRQSGVWLLEFIRIVADARARRRSHGRPQAQGSHRLQGARTEPALTSPERTLIAPSPRARPSIFSVSFQTRVPDTDVHVVDSRASPPPRLLQGVAESLMTTRTTSAFLEKGVVTPEELSLIHI